MKFFTTALLFATTFAIKLHQKEASPDEVTQNKAIFDEIDTDANGEIDADEFSAGLLNALEVGDVDQQQFDHLEEKWVTKFGDDQSGSLNFNDFMSFTHSDDEDSDDDATPALADDPPTGDEPAKE